MLLWRRWSRPSLMRAREAADTSLCRIEARALTAEFVGRPRSGGGWGPVEHRARWSELVAGI
jgi:hypothetical protein